MPPQSSEYATTIYDPRIAELEEEIREAQAQILSSDLVEELEEEYYHLLELQEQERNWIEQIQARRAIDLDLAYRWDGTSGYRALRAIYANENAAEEEALRQERAHEAEEEASRLRQENELLEQLQRLYLGVPQVIRPQREKQPRPRL
ncbi:MAG: hypothetical protein M1812_002064 [Candelaria pacifica]|nr:MAG: hypothetical protein M1812_002064 [Candelaria pacifica]